MTRFCRFLLALAAVVAVLSPAPARGASFTVSPIQVYLSTKQPSAIMTVRNDSQEPMRFQLTAVKWEQADGGEMQLTPTTDVVFFPRLLTLRRGEQRNVRIGLAVPYGDTEKTYRLFIEELPQAAGAGDGGTPSVQMRTRIGVPIFATPTVGRAGAVVTELRIENGRVTFRLENRGTSHILPESIRVLGQARGGGAAFERPVAGWYVLAGRSQKFDVALSGPECAGAASITADVQVDEMVHLTATVPVAAGACGPAGGR